MKTIYRFLIYGFIGIQLEVFWTSIESLTHQNYTLEGTTYMWMILIYGLGVFLEPIQKLLKNINIMLRGIIYMTLIYIIEYITGILLFYLIGTCPWNYTDPYSINGIITLSFIPVWFVMGLLFERIRYIMDSITIKFNISSSKIYLTSKKKQL